MDVREPQIDLLSPPRPQAQHAIHLDQSTPIRPPRPTQNQPEPKGSTLKSLTDADKAILVLKIRETEHYYKGRNDATQHYALRRGPNRFGNPEYKMSFILKYSHFMTVSCLLGFNEKINQYL